MRRYLWLLLIAAAIAVPASAQLFNLTRTAKTFEGVFDNNSQPLPFLSTVAAISYDKGGLGIAFNGVQRSDACGDSGASWRSDYLNFKSFTWSLVPSAPFINCTSSPFAAGTFFNYTISVAPPSPGPLTITLYAINFNPGSVWRVNIDNQQIASITMPGSGDFVTVTSATSSPFNISPGFHTMSIIPVSGVALPASGPLYAGDFVGWQGAVAGSSVPAAAQAAGFTTLIYGTDFTSPANANASAFMFCAGASSPQWWSFPTPGQSSGPPPACPSVTTDSGQQVLQLIYLPTDGSTGNGVNSLVSSSPDGSQGIANIPLGTFYVEGEMRTDNVSNTNGGFLAPWVASQGGCSIEWDSFEFGFGGGYDAAFHNCGSGAADIWVGSAPPNPPPGFSISGYHKYGMRVTTDGSTAIFGCTYIDNILQGSCLNAASLLGSPSGATLANPGHSAMNGGQVGDFGQAVTSTVRLLVRHVYVWSCANWNNGDPIACKTSNPNP